MDLSHLYIGESNIPGTGKGLFTRNEIQKGNLIIEYTGDITNWESVRYDATNVYIYFINDNYVINAKEHPEAIARYANDANGLTRIKGVNNNSRFVNIDGKIFIRSTKIIRAGSEILVNYGKGYWETVRTNLELLKKIK